MSKRSCINTQHNNLIQKLIDHNIVLFDKKKTYRLKSGTESCLYIDFRRAISFPELQEELCSLYCAEISKPFATKPDCIVGVPDGAVPLAAQISAKLSIPLIMIRKEPKKHGTGKLIEGIVKPNAKVVVIEDIISSGASCIEIVTKLRDNGLIPIQIICLLKRSRISLGKIFGTEASRGLVPLRSLLSMRDLEFNIKLKSSKLCIAADVTTMDDLSNIIEKASPYASIIKIHIDMIRDFEPFGVSNSIARLQYLKNKFGVLLWEDRKFADIPSVTHQQILYGIHQISSWADIISAHTLVGPELFKKTGPYNSRDYFDGCKIIVIGQMSSKGTLTDQTYLQNSINMVDPLGQNVLDHSIRDFGFGVCDEAVVSSPTNTQPPGLTRKRPEENDSGSASTDNDNATAAAKQLIENFYQQDNHVDNIIGIVTQTDIKTNLLKITPGIRHDADKIRTDHKGQQYRMPSEVPWADIIVAGRGIIDQINSPKLEDICKQYLR